MCNKSVSIIVPAYNEGTNLSDTIKVILKDISSLEADYEIIIFDDYSTDNTGSIADELQAGNPNIKVIHNERNMGMGYNVVTGMNIAKNDYVFFISGDNPVYEGYTSYLIEVINKNDADMIIPYTVNTEARNLARRLISAAFTILLNALFGLDLKYYNGGVAYKRTVIQSINIRTHSFAFQAEALLKLIRTGYSYIEIPVHIRERESGGSKAFRINNIIRVIGTIVRLFWEINIAKRSKYNAAVRCLGVVEPEAKR
jgi:glycosyltransferase involved in cell wall biosynthesis